MAGQLPMMEEEGSEKVTECNRLKLVAEGGKKRITALLENIP
ncbi:MAG TPA: hypothetical protein VER35_00970 [Candidatus Limnocylindrales bacterium]|nr:hypothetical protein [Candidatus Limnocylindrales bacterium]